MRVAALCLRYARKYWRAIVGVYVLMAGISALSLVIPQLIRWIIDQGIRDQDVRFIGAMAASLVGLTVVKGVFVYFEGRWSEMASQGVAYDLRNTIYSRLAALSFSYHDRTETGQHLSRTIQDVERLRFLTGRAVLRLVEGVVLFVGSLGVLLVMNAKLALLSLAAMPLLSYLAYHFGRRFRPLSLLLQNQLGALTTRLEQNLRGFRIVKAFAQEDAEIERFERENSLWFSLAARLARYRSFFPPLMNLAASLVTVFVIWFGGHLVITGESTLGELVAFTTYLGQLTMPIRRLGHVIPAIAMAVSAGERVLEILEAVSEVEDKPGARDLSSVRGKVTFEGVSFGYYSGDNIVEEVSFEVAEGKIVALLGETGCGKSTIVHLIPRFCDAKSGRILIDGADIRDVTVSSLRRYIGIVLQETTLFAATVRENIGFGRPEASFEEIRKAARAAQAEDFIENLTDGYETAVGERGVTLSGGQKQRVAIARALLKDPRILILDDATSSVDTETEHLIQKALMILMEGRTSFVIAQRLSTVRRADLILVLEKGRIAASGTHSELLRTSGIYADIYNRQLRRDEEPAS